MKRTNIWHARSRQSTYEKHPASPFFSLLSFSFCFPFPDKCVIGTYYWQLNSGEWAHNSLVILQNICCVSIQGLHPTKDPAFAVFEGETLWTVSSVVKWDGLVFGAFPGCITRCFTFTSQFLTPRPTKVTIYATRMSPFSLFFSSFSVVQRMSGYVRPWRIVAVHPSRGGKRRSIWRSLRTGTAFVRRCDVIGLQMLLWRMQTLNWDTATV